MVIAGAGGHSREIITELHWLNYPGPLYFFDETIGSKMSLYDLPVLHNEKAVHHAIAIDKSFVIAVGSPALRELLYWKFKNWGAEPYSLISRHAIIGHYDICLGEALNVMASAVITASVTIGTGTLVHAMVSIHHDCVIGDFCELSPGCKILGKVRIGNYTTVGCNAVLLPGITIGSKAIIGAGAVVTKNVPDGVTVKGVPGRW